MERVPFGLRDAAPFSVRHIASSSAGMKREVLLAFFDDVSVFSPTFAKHCKSLDRALTLIEEAGPKVKPEKCRALPQHAPFVGHILSSKGVSTDPEKVSAVKSWPPPTSVSQSRVFPEKIGHYRKFTPDFATLSAPSSNLRKRTELCMVQQPPKILRYPEASPTRSSCSRFSPIRSSIRTGQ